MMSSFRLEQVVGHARGALLCGSAPGDVHEGHQPVAAPDQAKARENVGAAGLHRRHDPSIRKPPANRTPMRSDLAVAAIRAIVSTLTSSETLGRLAEEIPHLSSRAARFTRIGNNDLPYPAGERHDLAPARPVDRRQQSMQGCGRAEACPARSRRKSFGGPPPPTGEIPQGACNPAHALCLIATARAAALLADRKSATRGRAWNPDDRVRGQSTLIANIRPLLMVSTTAMILLAGYISALLLFESAQPRVETAIATEARKSLPQRSPSSLISPVPIVSQSSATR